MAAAPKAPVEVSITWRGARAWATRAQVQAAVTAAAQTGRTRLRHVSIVFVPTREMRRLHRVWLADPSATDVITFDLRDDGEQQEGSCDAELIVGAEHARRVAKERGVPALRELLLYIVHGVLHVCGYDDHTPRDRQAMRRAETRTMRALGWADDPLPHDD